MLRSPVTRKGEPSCESVAVTCFCVDSSAKVSRRASPFAAGRAWRAQLDQALLDRRADVHASALVVTLVDQRGKLLEDLHEPADVAAHHRREVLAEARVVVALADQLHEGVDGDERVLDLVRDARHHPGEELELLGRRCSSASWRWAVRSSNTSTAPRGSVPSPITG